MVFAILRRKDAVAKTTIGGQLGAAKNAGIPDYMEIKAKDGLGGNAHGRKAAENFI